MERQVGADFGNVSIAQMKMDALWKKKVVVEAEEEDVDGEKVAEPEDDEEGRGKVIEVEKQGRKE